MKMKTNPAHNSSTMEPMLRRSPYLSALCTDPQSGPLGPSAVARRPRSQPPTTTTATSTSAGARGCGTGGNSSDPSSTATGTSTRSNKRKASDAGSHGSGNFAELFELRRPSSGSQNNGNGSNNNVDALVSQLRIQSMHSIAEAGSSSGPADDGNSAAKRRASNIRSGRRSSTPSFDTSVSGGGFAPASTAVDSASDPTTRKFQYYHPNPFTSTNNLVARLAEEKELVGSSSSSTTTGSSSAAQSHATGSARRVSAPLVSEYGSESDSSTSGLDSNPTTPTATQRRTVSSANYAKRRTRTLPVMTTSVTANFFPAVLDRGDGEDAGARNEAWKTIKLEYWDGRGERVNEPPESLGGPSPSPQNASMGQAPRGMSSSLPANYPPSSSTTASGDAPSDMTSALASSFVRRDESTDRFARLVSEFSKSSAGGFHFGSSGGGPSSTVRSGSRRGNANGTSGMHRSRTEAGLSFGRIGPEMMSSSLPRR